MIQKTISWNSAAWHFTQY